jgi:N-acetylglucosamine-6-phosphate deacetylase
MGEILMLRGRIVTGSTAIDDGVIAVDGEHIAYVGPASGFPGAGEPEQSGLARAGEFILLPGLVDLHCHGGGGSDFSEGSAQAARSAARFLHGTGTTTLLASLVTASSGAMLRNLHAIRSVVEEGLIAGAHLEGPFLSPHQHGAHDPALLREPDPVLLSELLAAAGSTLASMTCAAELPGMLELVDQLTARGVVPSLGHTEADAATAADFLQRAALGLSRGTNSATGPAVRPTVTHLFNAMAPLHHRSPGPVAASLTQARAGRAVVELIADGVHLAADTVRMVFDLVGADNIALVTDSMAATGLGDGRYTLGSLTVTVHQGVARLERTGVIAGGTATLLDVVRAAVASGVPLQDAVRSASAVPASVLGLSRQVGDLQKGMRADVVIVDADLALAGVLRQGRWVRQLGP